MATTYTYSISADFTNGINNQQFYQEIVDDIIIVTPLNYVQNYGDIVDINFSAALSGAELTELDALVAAHIPQDNPVFPTDVEQITINGDNITQVVYTKIGSITFTGFPLMNDLGEVWVLSFMDGGGVSYDVRLFDITNSNEITTGNFSNTTIGIQKLGSVSNVPTGEAILELQAKVNGATTAHVESLVVHYN